MLPTECPLDQAIDLAIDVAQMFAVVGVLDFENGDAVLEPDEFFRHVPGERHADSEEQLRPPRGFFDDLDHG